MVRVSLLSIGDELLCGEVVDTNQAHISQALFEAGFENHRRLSVADDPDEIVCALSTLAGSSQAVVVTGGLGPTDDDVTAEGAARATGDRRQLFPEALAHLERWAQRRGRVLHPENRRQALLPSRARLIDNPLGTACGFELDLEGSRLFFLPGVPSEMEAMLGQSVLPALAALFPGQAPRARRTLKLFGISEAAVGGVVSALPLPAQLQVAYCVRFPEVHLILRGSESERPLLDQAAATLKGALAEWFVAEDAATVDSALAELCRAKGATLALAESCTGGMIASRITDRAGSSAYFLEGNVTYSNEAKSRLLKVPPELIGEKGAVSSEVARAMALGARAAAGSTIALSVTGVAGPEGGSPEKPVGTVFMALAHEGGCEVRHLFFPGSRDRVREYTCYSALDWLRRELAARPDRPE